MKKRRIIGLSLIVFSICLSFVSLKISGSAVSEGINYPEKIFIFIMFAFGILLATFSPTETTATKPLEVLISRKALSRARKDSFIRENIDAYGREIEKVESMVAENPTLAIQRAKTIGEFTISPTGYSGRGGPRVAWEYDPKTNTLKIHDVLYHEKRPGSAEGYIDDWDRKAQKREITRKNYEREGFVRYKSPAELRKQGRLRK